MNILRLFGALVCCVFSSVAVAAPNEAVDTASLPSFTAGAMIPQNFFDKDTGGLLVKAVGSSTIATGAATSAKQDTGNTSLATIAAKDFSTQTTLAAVLAKIIAAPATAANQATEISSLATIAANSAATSNSFVNITTAATTVVKSGAGTLHTLTVNNLGTVASLTVVYDNTAGSGTKIASINTLAGQESYFYDVAFTTGLTIVTTGTVAPDVTVSYR